MSYELDALGAQRVVSYFERIGRHLKRREQRESFAMYAFGVLSEGDRKSVEPIAGRLSTSPQECARVHDHLLRFVGIANWDDMKVRREAAWYAIEALSKQEPVTTWIVDDTGMLKQGKHSPGVQRQYTGSAGKIANCQLAVSLSIATRSEQVPIDMALYLPESWTSDLPRRRRAHVPDSITFKTKVDLALDLIERAVDDKVPGEVVLADSAFGRSHVFRDTCCLYGLDYAVAVDADSRVWTLDSLGRRRDDPITVAQLGVALGEKAFRRVTWRTGTKQRLSSRFAFRRIKSAHNDDVPIAERSPIWVVIEWPEGEASPTKFFFTTLARRMTKKQIVRVIKERWKTERVYQELKGELGFDHFEGRSFRGWHHHVSVVLCCYAFVIAERVRAFPPSAAWAHRALAHAFAA